MGFLDSLVYFVDVVCTSPYVVHFAFGVFFGFIFGHAHPRKVFWVAAFVGFSKETIDFFKHSAESASFSFLTDPKYGIHDGLEDWLFWMIGGYVGYLLLERSHRLFLERYEKERLLKSLENPAHQLTESVLVTSPHHKKTQKPAQEEDSAHSTSHS